MNLQKCLRVNEVNDSFKPRKVYIIDKTTIKGEITSSSRRLFISPSGKPSRANRTAYLKSELKAMLPLNVREKIYKLKITAVDKFQKEMRYAGREIIHSD